jgi:hypothetical protein
VHIYNNIKLLRVYYDGIIDIIFLTLVTQAIVLKTAQPMHIYTHPVPYFRLILSNAFAAFLKDEIALNVSSFFLLIKSITACVLYKLPSPNGDIFLLLQIFCDCFQRIIMLSQPILNSIWN